MSKAFDNSQLLNGNTALREAIKTVDGAGSGIDADQIHGTSGSRYVNKRIDYATYGSTITIWDGLLTEQDTTNKKLGTDISYGVAGTATVNDTMYLTTLWNNHHMIFFSSTDNTAKGLSLPTNYGWLEFPVSSNTHNTLFLKHITRNRWTAFQVSVIDPTTNTPIALLQANTNNYNDTGINTGGGSNSSFLGPDNIYAAQGQQLHEWVSYIIPKRIIDMYAVNGRLKVSINLNSGIATSNYDTLVHLAGVAVVENPRAISAVSVLNLHWTQHSGTQISWSSSNWNREALATLSANTIYSDVRLPIVDINEAQQNGKDLYVGIISHNHIAVMPVPFMTNNSTGITYMPSESTFSTYKQTIDGRAIYRRASGFVIPAEDLGSLPTLNGMYYLSLTIESKTSGSNIRGMYTEFLD